MNYDKIERKNLAYHFEGQLKKGYPRQYVNYDLIKELSEQKVMVHQMWKIKLEVPLDLSFDCDQAMPWVQTKIFDFMQAGFYHLGTHAAVKEVTRDGRKADEPFWFIDVIHPEYKDPRETVKRTVNYDQPIP